MNETNPNNKPLEGEIIERRFEGLDSDLQDIADKMEVALLELENYPGERKYNYDNDEKAVIFNLNGLSEAEINAIEIKIGETNLGDLYDIAIGANESEVTLIIKQK